MCIRDRYLPGLRDVAVDLRRSIAAITYRSPHGNAFDSFAPDIESQAVPRASTRTRRLLAYSARLRAAVGRGYPLGAIIPSPRNLDIPGTFWPGFPFHALANTYDVLLPMSYFTYSVSGEEGAHAFTAENIEIIRRRTGDPTVPIHVIGGIGPSPAETRGFVAAVRERGVIGASYYTFPTTPMRDWRSLRSVLPIPDAAKALPVVIPNDAPLGNVPERDTTHPREVVYKVSGRRGRYRVAYQGFDVDLDEVTVLVNWRRVGTLSPTKPDAWGEEASIAVPRGVLHRRDTNYVAFVAKADHPHRWPTWGVRSVHLVRPGG